MEVELTINTDPLKARHIMVFFSHTQPTEKEFTSSVIGYRTDFEGVGVYLFRHLV